LEATLTMSRALPSKSAREAGEPERVVRGMEERGGMGIV